MAPTHLYWTRAPGGAYQDPELGVTYREVELFVRIIFKSESGHHEGVLIHVLEPLSAEELRVVPTGAESAAEPGDRS